MVMTMKNNSIILNLVIFISVFFVDLIVSMSAGPRYIPDIDITINCGFSGSSKAFDERQWIGDIDSKFTPIEKSGGESSRTSIAITQHSTVSEVPYMTARFSPSEFTYSLPVTPGPKFIRLYFYPASYSGFNGVSSFFTVKAGSFTLLKNFSASLTAMSLHSESFTREYIVNIEVGVQKLNISFIPSPNSYVFINGIEVVSMPADLYYSPEGLGARYIGQTSMYNVQYDKALQTIYRLNVGGPFISAVDDTGMFRTWSSGVDYVDTYSFIQSNESIEITFNNNIPNYTAPDEIYKTAVTMRNDPDENLKNNLTLKFLVDSGFMYLVRLHFCEFKTPLAEINSRVFKVYLNQQTDNAIVDIFNLGGRRLGSPVWKDYVVIVGDMGVRNEADLRIDFHPEDTGYCNAIINGVEIFKMSFENSLAGPNPDLKLQLSLPPAQPSLKKFSVTKLILIALGVCLSLVCSIFFAGYFFLWRMRKGKPFLEGKSSRTTASSLPDERCRRFSLAEILEATNDFDRNLIVGVGGFGDVYRGYFEKKNMIIAVKRLNPESRQGNPEFMTEIEFLSELRHSHLVSLLGYCIDEEEKLLIYEYMANGTLREHLYGSDKDPLPWRKRLEICIGAARGLNYLHSGGAGQPIIHRDVKTTNILLDHKWVAKVSDFGLSRMGRVDSAVSTLVKGTLGYLDPEYLRKNKVSEKADVYAFGVVLFEVLCARKPFDQKLEDHAQWHLAQWAKKCIDNEVIHQIIDSRLIGKIAPKSFEKFVEIAAKCIREKITNRPSMNDVVEQLQFVLQLQMDADAAKQEIAVGEECVYPELRYRVPSSKMESQNDDIDEEDSDVSDDTDSKVKFSSTIVS